MTENANSTGSAREEAERLVAAALAAASVAARGIARNASPLAGVAGTAERLLAGNTGGHVATGSAECCVCPLCRAIAAVRDPSPELALKLASGASDLASGLSGVLRSVSDLVSGVPVPRSEPQESRPRPAPDPDSVWHTATTRRPARSGGRPADRASDERSEQPAAPDDPWAAATADDPWHAATTAPVPPAGPPEAADEPAPPDAD
ncbi:hypothetical protein [Rugosimonospora africana]|uniref:Uncharacterized protein n=1 Tax=Rugosimonospora africana TaxID=556532 RepID=A0A8J3VU63_9ACTN|nr:hypothetical protein [Rugosimonospora africana]GIH18699.1 hypothetical protein Raf01_68710 [Rugosimonospora africana]